MFKLFSLGIILACVISENCVAPQILSSNLGSFLPSTFAPLYPMSNAPAAVSQFLSGITSVIRNTFHYAFSSPVGGPPFMGTIRYERVSFTVARN